MAFQALLSEKNIPLKGSFFLARWINVLQEPTWEVPTISEGHCGVVDTRICYECTSVHIFEEA